MRVLVFVVLVMAFSTKSHSLGMYESLSENTKGVLNSIVKELGIEDSSNDVKDEIYRSLSFAFDGTWNSYWTGLAEMAASKYQNDDAKGFIELAVNHSTKGTMFLTFYYREGFNQIIVIKKQVRYGTQKGLLEEFEKRKANTELYVVRHESDNYALLQEKGKVAFEYYHVGVVPGTSSLVYQSQIAIDL